eukprot:2555339-Rhodomonas_salina.3
MSSSEASEPAQSKSHHHIAQHKFVLVDVLAVCATCQVSTGHCILRAEADSADCLARRQGGVCGPAAAELRRRSLSQFQTSQSEVLDVGEDATSLISIVEPAPKICFLQERNLHPLARLLARSLLPS